MDCAASLVLRAGQEAEAMNDPDTRDLIGHLFALVTARLEDATALAVDGQTANREQAQRLGPQIKGKVEEVCALIGAVEAI
jgi:hypothetical protein